MGLLIGLSVFTKTLSSGIFKELMAFLITLSVESLNIVCLQAKVHQSHLSVLYFKPS